MANISLFLLLLSAVTVFAIRDKLVFENCGGNDDVIQVSDLSLNPMPITIPGELRISAKVTLKRDLSVKTKIHVKLYKQTYIIFPVDIKVPCIKNGGSCSYDSCSLIDLTHRGICDFIKDVECSCPFKATTITVSNHLVKIPSVPGVISWMAKGDYKAEVRIYDEVANQELGCFRAYLSLQKG